MSIADTYVRARIDTDTKNRASDALNSMGLSISDAIRMLMFRVAEERCLPFEVRVPNEKTVNAMVELDNGGGRSFASVEALMADMDGDED